MTQFTTLPGFAAAKSHMLEQALTISDLFDRISHIDDAADWLDPDDEAADGSWMAPPAPNPINGTHCTQALAILQLAKACEEQSLPDRMHSGQPVRLNLGEHEMSEIFEIAAHALYPTTFTASGPSKIWRAPTTDAGKTIIELGQRKLRSLLQEGNPVLMLSSTEQVISRQVLEVVGHDLYPATITQEMILAVLSLTHAPTSPRVAEKVCATLPSPIELARLNLLKLTIAFQAESALVVAQRLSEFAQSAPQNTGPKLEDVFGQREAVSTFKQLKADVEGWQAGALSWAEVTSSFLLFGPPGCGKTLLPTAFANSAGLPLISTSYSDCQMHGHQGDMLKALDAAVSEAITLAPAVFFIDEIDAFYARDGDAQGNRYILGVVTGLLTQIDRLNATEGLILLSATNYPDLIDQAIVRAGRFDRHIAIKPLDLTAITAFLSAKLGDAIQQPQRIAEHLIGATGAEIDAFIRKSRTLARELQSDISDKLLLRAAALYLPNPDPPLLRRIAAHEAGHLLVGHLLGTPKASLARVTAKGGAVLRPHRPMQTNESLNADLAMLMGGRAAEQLLCTKISNGAGCGMDSDLAQATRLALQAESQFGFGDVTTLWQDLRHPIRPYEVSQDVAVRAADRLKAAEVEAVRILMANLPALNKISDSLFGQREIEGHALDQLLEEAMRAPPETESQNTQTKTSDSEGTPQSSQYGKSIIV